DAQHGRADEAMRFYTSAFPNSRVEHVEHYAADEGPEDTVKHGRFVLDGQELVAMDSHVVHAIAFNEGLSLQVLCDDQAEFDRYWAALNGGGEEGPCGWLKDRFVVSWQVVPRDMARGLASDYAPARGRAFQAVMKMKKIDIAAIEAAF